MTHLRRMSSREVLKALAHFGFQVMSTRGSHAKLRRTVGNETQTLTVPTHKNLAPGTLHAIFRQACHYIPESELLPWFFTETR